MADLIHQIEATAAAERSKKGCRASRRGEDPGTGGPGDPARNPGSVTGSFRPRRDAEDPEELWDAYGRFVAAY